MRYILDASAAAKLFIREEGSEGVFRLVEGHIHRYLQLSAPTLIIYELGNVFWKHPEIDADKAHHFIMKFLDLNIELMNVHEDEEVLREICDISKNMNITFYDASYIALARRMKAKMITADERLKRSFPETATLIRELVSESA